MSWNTEVIMVAGYKIPRDVFQLGYNKWEEMTFGENGNPDLAIYADNFIDTDPCTGEGPVFFGEILHFFDPAEEINIAWDINKIYTPAAYIVKLKAGVHDFFDDFLPLGFEFNFSKWVTVRLV